MQGMDLFEYAVIRFVPRVEREEFINIGVVLYCRDQKFLETRFTADYSRCARLFEAVDAAELEEHIEAFRRIAEGSKAGGPIAGLPPAERFRWLTAKRSTIIQTSPVHPGMCTHAGDTLQKLYEELVE